MLRSYARAETAAPVPLIGPFTCAFGRELLPGFQPLFRILFFIAILSDLTCAGFLN